MVAENKPKRDYGKLEIRDMSLCNYRHDGEWRRVVCIQWSWPGVGFGECTFRIREEIGTGRTKWELETETLGGEFAQALMKKFVAAFEVVE